MRSPGFVTRWIGSIVVLTITIAWLHRVGRGDLAAPTLSIEGISDWLDRRDTIVAAFALVRLAALGFALYRVVLLACGGVARYFQLARMTSFVDRLTLPFARGLLGGMAVLGAPASTPSTLAPDIAVLHDISAPADPHASLQLLPETQAQVAPTAAIANDDTWVVQHGESFWSIAAEHLADAVGHPVSDRDIAPYWHRVVEVNRPNLVTHDPDLLFAGQVIELPAVFSG